LKSWTGSGVFAVRSSRRTRLIWLSGLLPHDDLPAPTATHTLQESRRVCDSIAWLAVRGDFTRGSVMKHRHDSIVAIGNTPKPNAEGRTQPPLPTSPPIATRRGRGARKRRLIDLIETGGSRHRHFDAGPLGLKSAGGTPWLNSRNAWTKSPQRRLHTAGTPVLRGQVLGQSGGPEEKCDVAQTTMSLGEK
jgi:hypothetical protein